MHRLERSTLKVAVVLLALSHASLSLAVCSNDALCRDLANSLEAQVVSIGSGETVEVGWTTTNQTAARPSHHLITQYHCANPDDCLEIHGGGLQPPLDGECGELLEHSYGTDLSTTGKTWTVRVSIIDDHDADAFSAQLEKLQRDPNLTPPDIDQRARQTLLELPDVCTVEIDGVTLRN